MRVPALQTRGWDWVYLPRLPRFKIGSEMISATIMHVPKRIRYHRAGRYFFIRDC